MMKQTPFTALLLALALGGAGCRKEEIRVYRVPKEKPAQEFARPDPHSTGARLRLGWKLPAGWTEEESDPMRVASFSIEGAEGQHAEVAAIPIPGMKSADAEFVNLWRKQLQLEPVTPEQLPTMMSETQVGDATGKLFDVVANDADAALTATNRIIVAVAARQGLTWFFKLQGDAPVVIAQKPTFVEFLKSVDFREADAFVASARSERAAIPPSGDTSSTSKPQWEVPAGWREVAPTQMILAKFELGDNASKADVTVSSFSGPAGGLKANVDRWRGQLGLPAIAQTELNSLVQPLDVPGEQAMLVDMSGSDSKTGERARIIGVIVPRGKATWFFKLMGDGAVAEREKAAFLKFVQSVRYPNA
jgi:hypothetical protein